MKTSNLSILLIFLTFAPQIFAFDLEAVDNQIIFIPIADSEGQEDTDIPVIDELEENSTGVDRELTETEKLALGFERQTVQPTWIDRMGISSQDIHDRVTASEDFVEVVSSDRLVAFDSENDNKKHTFIVTFIKASDWIFLTFEDIATQQKHNFFFPYANLVTKDVIYLREMLEECTFPKTHQPSPPTIAKCHYFYKKVSEAYDFSVKEVGPVQGAELMECYIESVKKMTRQPRVEILCVEGAIQDAELRQLTREQYDSIKANHTDMGNGKFEGQMEESVMKKVEGK